MNRVSDGVHTCTILRSQQFLLGGDASLCQITLTTCYHWFYNLPQWFDSPNLYWQCVSSTCSVVILLRPSYIGERSIVMSVSVFVCLSASIYPVTACPIFTKSVCMLHMAVARFTVSWRSDTSCTSGFIWVTSCLHVMTRNRRCEKGVYSKRFNRGQHGFDTAAYTKTDSPGATRNWGRI